MSQASETIQTLRQHLILGREILQLAERENQELRSAATASSTAFEFYQRRQSILPRLGDALERIKKHRRWWSGLSPAERSQHPEMPGLLRANQDLIMKIVVLDRENEQARLRLGILPPSRLPSVHQQRPHYVADLYRRHQTPDSQPRT